jgi:hypothetical protein
MDRAAAGAATRAEARSGAVPYSRARGEGSTNDTLGRAWMSLGGALWNVALRTKRQVPPERGDAVTVWGETLEVVEVVQVSSRMFTVATYVNN